MSAEAAATAAILALCRELGFARVGIANAEPSVWADELRAWLAAGHHGEMSYLDRAELLEDPGGLVPGARSIICVADRYHDGRADDPTAASSPVGRIARYARGDDYHTLIQRRLHTLCDALREANPEETFRDCVDTAPLLEREYAQRAGLGAVGKHTLVIESGVGSYLLLGEVVTTLELATTPAEPADPCGTCTACIDACPTDAITPWSVDAARCISYLTIEHRSEIDPALHAAMGDWIFGCDVCQEVCPHNQPTARSRSAELGAGYEPRRPGLPLLDVLNWTEGERRATFVKSSMKRAKLGMMKRNALIAAGNVLAERDVPALAERIRSIADDDAEDTLVRATAATVLASLLHE